MSWTVGVHTRGANGTEIPAASYEADQSKLPDMVQRIRQSHGHGSVVSVYTPEGHKLDDHHVDALVSGKYSAGELRHHVQALRENDKQSRFEHAVRVHLATHGSLPHSGVDAMTAGVPAASTPLGAHIMAGFAGNPGGIGYQFPHHSGDMSKPARMSLWPAETERRATEALAAKGNSVPSRHEGRALR